MSPSTGDDSAAADSSRSSGLANVFRGLTSTKSVKSPSLQTSSSSAALPHTDFSHATPSSGRAQALSSNQAQALDLLRHGTLNERLAAVDSLRFVITEFPLNPVVQIWSAGKDLIEPSKPATARIAGWGLLTECAKHASSTDLERREYFQTLSAKANPEDFHLQLAALVDLTNHGRVLNGFDYELLPLLTQWLQRTYQAAQTARKKAKHDRPSKAAELDVAVSGEVKNLEELFSFVTDVIKFSFNNADDRTISALIETLLHICMNTNVEEDLKACIGVVDAAVTFGTIPSEKLKDCVQVLSSIFSVVHTLSKNAWHTLANLCRSHNGQAVVRILLDVLRNLSTDTTDDKDSNREIRGSLAVLRKLMSKSVDRGYPAVPYALLMDGMSNVIKFTTSVRNHTMVLQLIATMFSDSSGHVFQLIWEEDWSMAFDVAVLCARQKLLEQAQSAKGAGAADDQHEQPLAEQLQLLIARLDVLIKEKSGDFIPRQSIITFFVEVHPLLPDSVANTVLEYFQEFRCCSPSDLQWEENLELVLGAFFRDRTRSSEVRLKACATMMDAYEVVDLVGDGSEQTFIPQLAKRMLQDIAEETDVKVLEAIMKLMISVISSCDMDLFHYILDTLQQSVIQGAEATASSTNRMNGLASTQLKDPDGDQRSQCTPAKVVTMAYVKMFGQLMNVHTEKSMKLYNILLDIAKAQSGETDAQLSAMKLLFRLRADWANRIFIATELETSSLATALCRTDESQAKKVAGEAAHSLRTSRSDNGALSRASRVSSSNQVPSQDKSLPLRMPSFTSSNDPTKSPLESLWKLPDPEAVPDTISTATSPILVSSTRDVEAAGNTPSHSTETASATRTVDTSAWLDNVLFVLQGCDWEVYSFVLVHLPSQLSNHAIFKEALPQIQKLRKLLCDQVRTNSFQEPPFASGLRRADVAICLYHSLTMILSYHEHFTKGEEDEIVTTFVHGISTWERCAKYCIHALSICCHELPLSTSKLLVQMLNQMAAVITQPHVSVHILEFLACLSRLHHIYVNFREEEYRIVFAICFRYLEYARDKQASAPNASQMNGPAPSANSPAAANETRPSAVLEDVPQYVHALAYHVILFWFLAMKLPDRANHVGYIVKRLFVDADKSQQGADEQAITSIDFLQRITYADVDESAEDPYFTEDRFGEMISKKWVIGNSIVTIKQAISTGWAQIIKRQPSGSSSYIVRETYRPPPPHQVENHVDISREGRYNTNMILPSHLLVQLMSPIPQSFDSARPIPLPDDDSIARSIKMFDLHSSVDGHKVGVVYIGEGQSTEREILSNVSGSSDYVKFLENLGTLTKLKDATFNTQGLDRQHDIDGEYTFCWRDRVTEIVFHVTTQMPNQPGDDQFAAKKRHIGNDFVNIIFNDSGLPFKFDTIPSQFNFVNIVITPASRATFLAAREQETASKETNENVQPKQQPFYRVQVLSKPGFPEVSPASEMKIVSLNALPGFVRLLALNASMFSLVWNNRLGGEHISSWTGRLREIRRLRDRYGPKVASSGPGANTATNASSAAHSNNSTANAIGAPVPISAPSPSPPPGHHVLGGGTSLHQGSGHQQQLDAGSAASSRPTSSTVRDSFTSLRRASVATFFTNVTDSGSSSQQRHSGSGPVHAGDGADGTSLVDSVDFSKWA